MPAIQLRETRPEEIDAIVTIWGASRRSSMPEFEARMAHTRGDDLAYFQAVICQKFDVVIALVDDEIVAMMAIAPPEIDQLYVAPEWQRRGVGSALIAEARRRSPERLILDTFQANARARAFYEKQGFDVVAFGVSPAPENEPDVHYEWKREAA
jgi:ribosomal protein S18 acetylase RimI-like enzyme